jgi:hypothetical protein
MDWRQMYPAAGKIRGNRLTLAGRIRLWKRRKRTDDLAHLRRWGA